MAKPSCYVCRKKPARRLKTSRKHYEHARTDPVFCSRVCAADYGLLATGIDIEAIPLWNGKGWDEGDEIPDEIEGGRSE